MLGHLHRNWLSYMVLALIALVFFSVEQVHHLFEPPWAVTGSTWLVAAGLYGFTLAVAVLYVGVSWWVAPFNLNTEDPQHIEPSAAMNFITVWHWAIAFACGLTFFAMYGLSQWIETGSHVVDHTVLLGCSFLFAAGAALAVAWNWLLPQSQRLLLRAFVALLGLNLLGELVWYVSNEGSLFSPRNYSIWAILHLAFCAFLIARVVDVWQCYSTRPVRGAAILLTLFLAAWSEPTLMGRSRSFKVLAGVGGDAGQQDLSAPQTVSEPFLASAWLVHLRDRLQHMPPGGPVVLVAASGGGSRAALFTALVYEDLAHMSLPFGGDGRTFVPANHILMISSVSGGTLASACYLDSTYAANLKAATPRTPLKNSIEEPLLASISSELKQLEDHPHPWYQRVNPETEEVEEDFVTTATRQLTSKTEARCFRSGFADDMCTDFMAPLLRGVIHPGRDRGESVQLFWETKFGLHDTNLDWLMRTRTVSSSGPPPALLCNVCEVERGTRLIVGFPPLPPGFLGRGRQGAELPREWVDLDARQEQFYEVSLADATRMSANFPWGFPIASVQIAQAATNEAFARPEVHLIDGGVRDNTGIDSLQYVIDALGDWAKKRDVTSEEDKYREILATEIVGELKERGVLLLEIDSGSKQESPGAISRALSGLLEPIDALRNAGYATAAAAVESHVEVLENSLPNSLAEQIRKSLGRLAAKMPADEALDSLASLGVRNVRRLTITCNHQDNVMTAWALGPTDKAQIFARFLASSARLQHELNEYLEYYAQLHSALGQLAARVDELERQEAPTGEDIAQVVDLYRRLSRYSLMAGNTQDLRIAIEKMYYRRVKLPEGFSKQVAEEVRSKPEWKFTLKKVAMPAETADVTADEAVDDSAGSSTGGPVEPAVSAENVNQYQVLGKRVDELNWRVKQQSEATFREIQGLSE